MSIDVTLPAAPPAAYQGRYRLVPGPEALRLPEAEWLVEPVLAEGSIAALIGVPASFKSFIAVEFALSIAAGRPAYGHPVRQGPVVYVAAEGTKSLARRLRGWAEGRDAPVPDRFYLLSQAVLFLDEGDVDDLEAAIAALDERPRLVVIDTLARAMTGGDENSARDMGMVIAGAERLRADGTSVLLVHHLNRQGGIRGSSALTGALDTLVEAKRVGERVTLVCRKQKDAEEFAPLTLASRVIDLRDGGTSLLLDADATAPARAGVTDAMGAAYAALQEAGPQGLTAKEWERACAGRNVGHTTFYGARKELEERGFVAKVGPPRGGRYTVALPLAAMG